MSSDEADLLVKRAEALLAKSDELAWPPAMDLDARVDAIMAALPVEPAPESGLVTTFLRFARPGAAVAAAAALLTACTALATGATSQVTSDPAVVVDVEQEAFDSAADVLALTEEASQ